MIKEHNSISTNVLIYYLLWITLKWMCKNMNIRNEVIFDFDQGLATELFIVRE